MSTWSHLAVDHILFVLSFAYHIKSHDKKETFPDRIRQIITLMVFA